VWGGGGGWDREGSGGGGRGVGREGGDEGGGWGNGLKGSRMRRGGQREIE